jgi:hypothetical protein
VDVILRRSPGEVSIRLALMPRLLPSPFERELTRRAEALRETLEADGPSARGVLWRSIPLESEVALAKEVTTCAARWVDKLQLAVEEAWATLEPWARLLSQEPSVAKLRARITPRASEDASYAFRMGQALSEGDEEELDDAACWFAAVKQISPALPHGSWGRSKALLLRARLRGGKRAHEEILEAVSEAEQAQTLAPWPELRSWTAFLAIELGEYARAAELWRSISEEHKLPDADAWRIWSLLKAGDNAGALQAAEECADRATLNEGLALLHLRALALGRRKQARVLLKKSFRADGCTLTKVALDWLDALAGKRGGRFPEVDELAPHRLDRELDGLREAIDDLMLTR